MFTSSSKIQSGKVIQERPQSTGPTKTRDLGNAWNSALFVSACESRGSEADKNRRERDEKMWRLAENSRRIWLAAQLSPSSHKGEQVSTAKTEGICHWSEFAML